MLNTFNLAANSTTDDLKQIVEEMKLMRVFDRVIVNRGNIALNDGIPLRRNKAIQFFEFMIVVLGTFE
jgi:hypothetical protein